MKTLKIISLLLLLIGSLSCRNDDNGKEPETVEEPFDITQYVIVGKDKLTGDFGNPIIPFIMTFDANGVCNIQNINGKKTGTYTYENNNLTVQFVYTAYTINTIYKIDGNTIISNSSQEPSYVCRLVKIPENNQLNANLYKGNWTSYPNSIVKKAVLKFTSTHFGEANSGVPETNKPYTLIKNIAAENNNSNVLSFWVLIDGKLEGSRFDINAQGLWSTGTFLKQ